MLFLFLMGFQLCSAQEKTTESSDSSPNKNVVYFTAGAFQPLAFGDNMANKALDKKTGAVLSLMFRFPDTRYRMGFYLSGFKASVKPDATPSVGNYTKTKINSFGLQLGYIFWEHSNWVAFADGGIGYTNYANSSEYIGFRDTGFSTTLSPTLQYNLHKNLGLYTALAYRHDFLKTNAPSDIKNFFRHQNYVMLNLGVVISF